MFAYKNGQFKVLRSPVPAFILLMAVCLPSGAWADCADTIDDPGKDTWVTYHTNKWSIWRCVRQSGDRKQCLPQLLGGSCAAPRVDGCSIPDSVAWTFTDRDKKIMKAACNEHDLCYSTAGVEKKYCDGALQENLNYLKNKFDGTFTVSVVVGAVVEFGDSGYESGQKWGEDNNCRAGEIRMCAAPSAWKAARIAGQS